MDPAGPSTKPSWISTPEQREEARKFCATAIERDFEERLKRWNAELDMLLVFAGLFSTALTAFIVQSYTLLEPNDTDTVIAALAYISSQVHSFSVYPNFVNATQRAIFSPAEDAPSFSAPFSAIWINALWFSSLICTLSASSIAVLVKQWLNQYNQSLSGSTPEIARLRQYRYDSLLKWQVPEIIATLPILLQVALALYLAGLLVLLWSLSPAVAITASVLVGGLVAFIITTTLLPIFYSDCCYQSPQALSVFLFAQGVVHFSSKVLKLVEQRAHESALEAASWTSRRYFVLLRVRDVARSSLKRLGAWGTFHNWHAREKPDAEGKHSELEQSLALTAYYITLDNSMLNTIVIPCLSDVDALSSGMSIRYGNLLRDVTDRLPSREWSIWRPVMPFVLVILSLITKEGSKGTVRKVLQAMPHHPRPSAKGKIGMLYLLAMSQLVSRRIAARDAFQKILVFLQNARIHTESSPAPGMAVLEDVEAAFPTEGAELEERVNLDQFESVSYYLTGVEYTIKYLLRHRSRLEQDGSLVPQRIKVLLLGLGVFLCSRAWRALMSRQNVVLWALRYSQLPTLIWKMKHDVHTADLVDDNLLTAFRDAVSVIENGFLTSQRNAEQLVTQGARRALSEIKTTLGELDGSLQPQSVALGNQPDAPPEHASTYPGPVHTRSTGSESEVLPTTPREQDAAPPTIIVSARSSTLDEDTSEIMNPWLELLNTLDPDLSLESSAMEQPLSLTEHVIWDVPDSPLPDPEMWRYYGATSPVAALRRNSFTGAGAQMLHISGSTPPDAEQTPRTQLPQAQDMPTLGSGGDEKSQRGG